MYIYTKLLHNWTYNTLLFTPGKTGAKYTPTQGNVLVTYGDNLSMLASDGYVAVEAGPRDAANVAVISGESLREAERYLRTVETEDVQVSVDGDTIFFGKHPMNPISVSKEQADIWSNIQAYVLSNELPPIEDFYGLWDKFALRPSSLSKFSLLRPQADYPVDFKLRETRSGQQLLVWKYGPDTRGVFSPLDRDRVAEAYNWPGDALWI